MLKGLIELIKGFLSFLKYPLIGIIGLVVLFFVLVFIWILIHKKTKKIKRKLSVPKSIKKVGILRRIFYQLPKQFALDLLNADADFFKPQGLVIFVGAQGSGKSVSMCKYVMDLQERYPKSKTITNMSYKYQDTELKHWKQLINYKNDKLGVIAVLDELQNWFGSNQSRNFPPEMLSVITQNRKNRRVLLGTAQNFFMLAKNIRTQTTEVREPITFLGCLTFVRRRKPIVDSAGDVVEWKNLGFYFFVHNEKLRDSFDTWKTIESLAKSGFQPVSPITETRTIINLKTKK
jgi:hypothetical protein